MLQTVIARGNRVLKIFMPGEQVPVRQPLEGPLLEKPFRLRTLPGEVRQILDRSSSSCEADSPP